jgi:epoxide hydrolase-like predicted phosphatase
MSPAEFERFVFGGESGRQAQLGQKNSEAYWRWLGDYFSLDETDLAQMRRDFFAGDALDEVLLAYIKRLRDAGYRTGLLSNAHDNARRLLTEVYPLIQYFDGVVISAEVGLMKPDPQIYHLAAESVGVQAPEVLFVDDFSENIEGAAAVGMQTLHFTDPEAAQRQLTAITGVT